MTVRFAFIMQEREAREDRHAAHKHTTSKQDMMRALHGHCLHGTREPEAREDRDAQHKHTTPNNGMMRALHGHCLHGTRES